MIEVRLPVFAGSLHEFTTRVRERQIKPDQWLLRPITSQLLSVIQPQTEVAAPPAEPSGAPAADPAADAGRAPAPDPAAEARRAPAPDPAAGDGVRAAADGLQAVVPPVDFAAAADALDDLVILIAWRRRYLFQKPRQRATMTEAMLQLRRLARLTQAVERERLAALRQQAQAEAAAAAASLPPPLPAALSPARILGILRRVQRDVLASRAQALLARLSREKWRVTDKLGNLFGLLRRRETVSFEQLLEDRRDPDEVVASLLAVLGAAKDGQVSLQQPRHFAPILIRRRGDLPAQAPAASGEGSRSGSRGDSRGGGAPPDASAAGAQGRKAPPEPKP